MQQYMLTGGSYVSSFSLLFRIIASAGAVRDAALDDSAHTASEHPVYLLCLLRRQNGQGALVVPTTIFGA